MTKRKKAKREPEMIRRPKGCVLILEIQPKLERHLLAMLHTGLWGPNLHETGLRLIERGVERHSVRPLSVREDKE